MTSTPLSRLLFIAMALLFAVPTLAQSETESKSLTKFEKDRRAILAMAGEYRVTFQFQETVPIAEGYDLWDPYRTGATEFVEVVVDEGDFISLQHVMVLHDDDGDEEPHVVKHWRQDWTYEDTELLRYRGHRTLQVQQLEAHEAEGKWTQAVFQVDDSPRYEGVGEWTHTAGRSAWESGDTWRPLPRREYTKRSDYDVMVSRNRHTITPKGWVHEQDSYKLVLAGVGEPERVLVHESGLNAYDRTKDVDFTAGREYWESTRQYWSDVRELWGDVLDDSPRITIQAKRGERLMYKKFFELAGEVAENGTYDSKQTKLALREWIEPFVARP